MEFLLLAKINTAFHIAEKVVYGIIGLFAVKIVAKGVKDYRDSIEEEKYTNNWK